MKRHRFAMKVVLSLSLLAIAAGFSMVLPAAAADGDDTEWVHVTEWKNSKGDTLVEYVNSKSEILIEIWRKDGGFTTVRFKQSGDPGPDDTSKGAGPIDVVALIKAGTVTYKVRASAEDTPLGKWLTREGNGAGPHINPSDDDNKGPGSAPVKKTGGLTQAQIHAYIKAMNLAARELQQLGTSMGDVEGLSSEEKPSYSSHSGGKKNGKNSDNGPNPNGSGKNKYLGSGFDSLGPHPELVNPPHSTSRVTTKTGASGKGSSDAMNPGLLESGGSTPGSQGPSATGTPLGSGISQGSSGPAAIR